MDLGGKIRCSALECAPVDPLGWTAGVIFIERIYPSTDSQGPTHLTMKSLVIEKLPYTVK